MRLRGENSELRGKVRQQSIMMTQNVPGHTSAAGATCIARSDFWASPALRGAKGMAEEERGNVRGRSKHLSRSMRGGPYLMPPGPVPPPPPPRLMSSRKNFSVPHTFSVVCSSSSQPQPEATAPSTEEQFGNNHDEIAIEDSERCAATRAAGRKLQRQIWIWIVLEVLAVSKNRTIVTMTSLAWGLPVGASLAGRLEARVGQGTGA